MLFGLARDYRILPTGTAETLVMVITLSMTLAPVLFLLNDTLLKGWAARHEEPEYDRIDEPANPVVIGGFGRFGQIIARILRMRSLVFDAWTKPELLKRAGWGRASAGRCRSARSI